MKIETSIAEMRNQLSLFRPQRTALVATMGNLHDGHIKLVEQANTLADRVVASIFVNPLQFGPNEDYHRYPRTFEEDCARLEQAGVDVLFVPTVEEMYPQGLARGVKVQAPEALGEILCGASRPGHFSGVATVVNMLFNIVQPDLALFGEKDYQQLLIIERMAKDLHMPVEVRGVVTVREEDGLAMSSRNQYLSAEQRLLAPRLYQTLLEMREAIQAGARDYAELERRANARLAAAGFKPDYLAVRRAEDLQPPSPQDRALRILAAAWLGQARLIDNLPALAE